MRKGGKWRRKIEKRIKKKNKRRNIGRKIKGGRSKKRKIGGKNYKTN